MARLTSNSSAHTPNRSQKSSAANASCTPSSLISGSLADGGKSKKKAKPLVPASKIVTETQQHDPNDHPLGNKIVETQTNYEKESPPAPKQPHIKFGSIHSLAESEKKPAEGTYIKHTLKRWDSKWYFIPMEYKADFSDLCFSLLARGGKGDSGGGAAATAVKKQTKAFENLNNQIMQQNSLFNVK